MQSAPISPEEATSAVSTPPEIPNSGPKIQCSTGSPHSQVPREMTRADMDQVAEDFVRAAGMADAAGFDLAELSDDHVRSENLRDGSTQGWREWEVELLEGAPDSRSGRTALLDGIEERLIEAGARPSASSSKLQRALGL